MTEVTKDEFFKKLYADKRDIMPTIVSEWSTETGYTSEWRTCDNQRILFGKSEGPIQHTKPSRYYLV